MCLGGVQVVDEVRVAEREMDRAAVRAPGGELAAHHGRDPPGRKLRVVGVGHGDRGRFAPDPGHRHHEELVLDDGQRLVAARRHQDLLGVGRAREPGRRAAAHAHVVLQVGAVPAHGRQPVRAVQVEDPLGVLGEVRARRAAHRRDVRGLASLGRKPDHLVRHGGGPRSGVVSEGLGRAPERNDAVAARRPGGRQVEAGVDRDPPGRPPFRIHAIQPSLLSLPRRVRDRPAIRRPRRAVLGDPRRLGEATRVRSVRAGDPELVHGGEGHPRAVGRGRGVADLAHDEAGLVGHGVVELRGRADLEVEAHAEGDLHGRTARDRDLPDLAPVAGDEVLRVRREAHPGKRVPRRPGLLIVMLHRVCEPALVPRVEVAQDQPGVLLVARAVDEPAAVRGERRTDAGAVSAGAGVRLAGLPVVDPELVLGELGVVLPVVGALREPDVALLRAEGRADRLEVLRLGDELRAATPVPVMEPQLRQPAAEASLRDDEVLAVGRPLRRFDPVRASGGDLRRIGAVGRHHVEVLAPVPVGLVGDPRSVGREARLRVEAHAGRHLGRVSALDRHREQVAEEVEDDGAPVGADVDGDPAALGEVDRQHPVLRPPLERQILLPALVRALLRVGRCGGEREGQREEEAEGRNGGERGRAAEAERVHGWIDRRRL